MARPAGDRWVPHDVLQSLSSVDDDLIALICPTCQMSTSALDGCRLLCMGLFSIFWLEAANRDDDDGAWLGAVALYFPSGFSTFTNSACTYSFPHTTCPVFSGSSLPLMPEIVPPASRTMICPAAMSQGCRLRSQ